MIMFAPVERALPQVPQRRRTLWLYCGLFGSNPIFELLKWAFPPRGITIRKGRRHIEESLPGILEDADNKLSGALRVLLTERDRRCNTCRGR